MLPGFTISDFTGLTFLFSSFSLGLNCPWLSFVDPDDVEFSCCTSVFSSIDAYCILLDEFHNTKSASASVIPRRQSSHLQIVVDKSDILSAFWERPSEKLEQLESIEFVRGKVLNNNFSPPGTSPVSSSPTEWPKS